jgi:putative serine protease PepD
MVNLIVIAAFLSLAWHVLKAAQVIIRIATRLAHHAAPEAMQKLKDAVSDPRNIAVFLALLLPALAQAGEPDEAYAKALPSTVYIRAFGPDWSVSSGTGVILGDQGGLIITAAHVVTGKLVAAFSPESHKDGELCTDATHYAEVTEEDQCVILATNAKLDLALLRFKTPRQGRGMRLAVHPARPGQAVYTIGNNGTSSMWNFASGNVRQVYNHTYTPKGWQQVSARIIEMSAPIYPGFSGGPIFNASGELLGINAASVTDSNQVHYGIDRIEIAHFIEEFYQKIKPRTTENEFLPEKRR